MKKSIFIVATLFISIHTFSQKEDFSFYDGKNYKLAEFRFWNPNLNDNYKGILVLNPGFNGDGRKAVLDPVWQKFATKHNLIIVASHFKNYKLYRVFNFDMKNKSGDLYIKEGNIEDNFNLKPTGFKASI